MTAATTDLSLEFRAVIEPTPGPALRAVFRRNWPAYHRWMLKRTDTGPTAQYGASQLHAHMPELTPIYRAILELVRQDADRRAHDDTDADGGGGSGGGGGDDDRARFLSLFAPTPIIRGCSQAVFSGDGAPMLIRNYDHAPHLCEGIVLASRWGGVTVNAVTDCLWGALDGVNDAGLVVALAFGGRKVVGHGFAASLIARYLLQTCATVRDALHALARLPVYMAYNFTLLDRAGEHATAYTAPDRPPIFEATPHSTNHQLGVEWPEYAHFTQTIERRAHLAAALTTIPDTRAAIDTFLRPPLFRYDYRRGSGTLYTALYDPRAPTVSLHWHGQSALFDPDAPRPARVRVRYLTA